jgi:hypothetical protein
VAPATDRGRSGMTAMRRFALLCVACFLAAACGTRDAGAERGSADAPRSAPPPASVIPASDDPPGCLHYEPSKSVLRGTLTRVIRYGPPNFGEDTLHDERLTVPILRLDSVIAVCGSPNDEQNSESERDVREVQLVARGSARRPLPRSGDVVVYGELFHWITGWHFTHVLLTVDSIRPDRPAPPRRGGGLHPADG